MGLAEFLINLFLTRSVPYQSCNVSGTLPPAWASYGHLATGVYINLYPVYIDLSRNLLTGDLPSSWIHPLMSCQVSRLDLRYNNLDVQLSSTSTETACNASLPPPCAFFTSVGRSIASFNLHVGYGKVSVGCMDIRREYKNSDISSHYTLHFPHYTCERSHTLAHNHTYIVLSNQSFHREVISVSHMFTLHTPGPHQCKHARVQLRLDDDVGMVRCQLEPEGRQQGLHLLLDLVIPG